MGEIPQIEADSMEWHDIPDESSEPDYEDMEQRAEEAKERLEAEEAADPENAEDPEDILGMLEEGKDTSTPGVR